MSAYDPKGGSYGPAETYTPWERPGTGYFADPVYNRHPFDNPAPLDANSPFTNVGSYTSGKGGDGRSPTANIETMVEILKQEAERNAPLLRLLASGVVQATTAMTDMHDRVLGPLQKLPDAMQGATGQAAADRLNKDLGQLSEIRNQVVGRDAAQALATLAQQLESAYAYVNGQMGQINVFATNGAAGMTQVIALAQSISQTFLAIQQCYSQAMQSVGPLASVKFQQTT